MQLHPAISRRTLLHRPCRRIRHRCGLVAFSAVAAEALPTRTVAKDPSCGCCGARIEHVHKAGCAVEAIEPTEVNRPKVRLGVPQALAPLPLGSKVSLSALA